MRELGNELHSVMICSKIVLITSLRSSKSSGIKKKNQILSHSLVPLEVMTWKLENWFHLLNIGIFPANAKNKKAAKFINYL